MVLSTRLLFRIVTATSAASAAASAPGTATAIRGTVVRSPPIAPAITSITVIETTERRSGYVTATAPPAAPPATAPATIALIRRAQAPDRRSGNVPRIA